MSQISDAATARQNTKPVRARVRHLLAGLAVVGCALGPAGCMPGFLSVGSSVGGNGANDMPPVGSLQLQIAIDRFVSDCTAITDGADAASVHFKSAGWLANTSRIPAVLARPQRVAELVNPATVTDTPDAGVGAGASAHGLAARGLERWFVRIDAGQKLHARLTTRDGVATCTLFAPSLQADGLTRALDVLTDQRGRAQNSIETSVGNSVAASVETPDAAAGASTGASASDQSVSRTTWSQSPRFPGLRLRADVTAERAHSAGQSGWWGVTLTAAALPSQ